ncbi:unnamed protein product [Somion occarium]|uniref:Uncharacterized protein n=1 Tax=Somion occarium TaxID=3059160 RepID=A0ABP1EBC7_9APHY
MWTRTRKCFPIALGDSSTTLHNLNLVLLIIPRVCSITFGSTCILDKLFKIIITNQSLIIDPGCSGSIPTLCFDGSTSALSFSRLLHYKFITHPHCIHYFLASNSQIISAPGCRILSLLLAYAQSHSLKGFLLLYLSIYTGWHPCINHTHSSPLYSNHQLGSGCDIVYSRSFVSTFSQLDLSVHFLSCVYSKHCRSHLPYCLTFPLCYHSSSLLFCRARIHALPFCTDG